MGLLGILVALCVDRFGLWWIDDRVGRFLGETYMAIAAQTGLSPALMHRVAVIGAGTLDILPHNGAVVTLLAVCGATHRQRPLPAGRDFGNGSFATETACSAVRIRPESRRQILTENRSRRANSRHRGAN